MSYQTISKWENGVTMPDIIMLPELAEFFHVTVDEILGLKPLEQEEYLSRKIETKEYWEKKLDYLLRTRRSHWSTDYMKRNKGDISYTNLIGNMITFGRKVSESL